MIEVNGKMKLLHEYKFKEERLRRIQKFDLVRNSSKVKQKKEFSMLDSYVGSVLNSQELNEKSDYPATHLRMDPINRF
jgi:hypothetical protein